MERETGFEPATSYLEGRHSATELLPLVPYVSSIFYTVLWTIVNVPGLATGFGWNGSTGLPAIRIGLKT
jgi:hypothetical protein